MRSAWVDEIQGLAEQSLRPSQSVMKCDAAVIREGWSNKSAFAKSVNTVTHFCVRCPGIVMLHFDGHILGVLLQARVNITSMVVDLSWSSERVLLSLRSMSNESYMRSLLNVNIWHQGFCKERMSSGCMLWRHVSAVQLGGNAAMFDLAYSHLFPGTIMLERRLNLCSDSAVFRYQKLSLERGGNVDCRLFWSIF